MWCIAKARFADDAVPVINSAQSSSSHDSSPRDLAHSAKLVQRVRVAEGRCCVLDASAVPDNLGRHTTGELRSSLASFVPKNATRAEQVAAIESGLRSPTGRSWREAMANWIVDEIVPVSRLVPEPYLQWRPPVRDAMTFVVSRLSPGRLAPKLLEQLELPHNTSPETRLLRLIAKVPGLQKLGQVIARNQHLRPALRNALARLENGIRDVDPQEIRS